jgi:membrane-associated phospholipid phosphatase
VATVIADRTDHLIVDGICYGLAALTSLSRIHEDKHWASDVLIGSAIGYFTAKKICALNINPEAPRVSAFFDLSGKRQTITLSLSF